jgi:hypothetical protein
MAEKLAEKVAEVKISEPRTWKNQIV